MADAVRQRMRQDLLEESTVKITNKGESTEIVIYEQIGHDPWFGEGVSSKSFRDAVKGVKTKNIDLRVNSPGGSVFESVAMVAALDGFKGTINAYVDGLAASAASSLIMAANKIVMAEGSMIMIHDPYTVAIGNAEDMLRQAELLEQVKGEIVKAYQRHSKLDAKKIEQMMSDETWMTADDAISNGFAHELANGRRVSNFADVSKYKYRHTPELKIAVDPELVKATEERKARLAALLEDAA
jgi:ATP-dependent Clp protease protease subunit